MEEWQHLASHWFCHSYFLDAQEFSPVGSFLPTMSINVASQVPSVCRMLLHVAVTRTEGPVQSLASITSERIQQIVTFNSGQVPHNAHVNVC